MAVRTAYDPTAGEVLTAANLEKLAGGWIGYAEATANQTGIGASTDLTSLSVAVTVGPSRRIRITVWTSTIMTNTNAAIALQIKEGVTTLTERQLAPTSNVTIGDFITASVVLTPTTGAHTYKASMALAAGAGTVGSFASATTPAWILVEDLGPAA